MRQTKDKLDLQLESNATSANGAKHISKFIGKRKRLRPKAKKANASKGNKNSKQGINYKIEKTANLSLLTGNLVFPWDEIEQDDSENPLREALIMTLRDSRRSLDLLDNQILLLKLIKYDLEKEIMTGFDCLKELPVEVSTEASSEGEG